MESEKCHNKGIFHSYMREVLKLLILSALKNKRKSERPWN